MIYGCLAAVAAWPHPVMVALALVIVGGRQLGLGILMHECAHRSLFATRALNDRVGQWLCARPMLLDLPGYRTYHLEHHRTAGSDRDPDMPIYKDFPISMASLRRKVIRDLTGQTGWKQVMKLILMSLGVTTFQLSFQVERGGSRPWREWAAGGVRLAGLLVIQGMIWTSCVLLGSGWLYLVWVGAYLSTYMLFSRIRNGAEHGAVPDRLDPDPVRHTRTTIARWWERLTFAPHHVNYHLEHHLLPNVPHQNLAKVHQRLCQSAAYRQADIAVGYRQVLRRLVDSTRA